MTEPRGRRARARRVILPGLLLVAAAAAGAQPIAASAPPAAPGVSPAASGASSPPPDVSPTVVRDAWVRGTTLQQKVSAAFMQLTATSGARLVAAESPIAASVELQQPTAENGAKPRQIEAIELPPGKAVMLTPNGVHLLLVDLKQPLKAGDRVPLTLIVLHPDGQREQIHLDATVKALGG